MEKEFQETNKQKIAGVVIFISDERNSMTTALLRVYHNMMIKRFSAETNYYNFKTYMPQNNNN